MGYEAFPSFVVAMIFYCRNPFFLCVRGWKLLIYDSEEKA
jgi:hypothetical protein